MDEKTTKHSGYVYNNRTKLGFQKMRRHGIVMPPFRIEDNVTRLLTSHFDRLIDTLGKASKSMLAMEKIVSPKMTTDSVYSEIVAQLQTALLNAISSDKKKLAKQIDRQLTLAQQHFFEDFLNDADDKVMLRVSFALDKDEVFKQKMAGLKEYYIDSSLERIKREEDFLKFAFLKELTDYQLGESANLDSLKPIIAAMKKTSVRESRFFARDQFARFNKAMTVASLKQSNATHVRWMTVQDGRVRPTHKALNGKVFPVDAIPEEQHDYNCRCSFYPIFTD
jgi:SPP1 gp7 family putative phage head morphogenesis protein